MRLQQRWTADYEMDEHDIEELCNEAHEHFEEGRLAEAKKCFKSALKLDPDNFNILFSLGALFHEMENFEDAIVFSRRALEIEPDNAGVIFNLGLSHDMLGESEEAIKFYSQAIENNPEYALAYFARGNLQLAAENYPAALDDFSNAVLFKTPYLNAWTNLAYCQYKTAYFHEALETYKVYEDLLLVTPDDEKLFSEEADPEETALVKGICSYMLGDDENAVKLLTDVTESEENRLTAAVYLIALKILGDNSTGLPEQLLEQLNQGSPGYTTLDTELLKCPHSRYLFMNEKPDITAEKKTGPMWSDGYVPGIASQAIPYIEYCPSCRLYHPVEDLIHIHDIPNRIYGGELPKLTWDEVQPEDFYIPALKQDWPADIEKNIRIRLLWKQNDNHREYPAIEISDYHDHHENLEHLLELLPEDTAPLRLAEFYRELGDFSRCIEILKSITPDPEKEFIKKGILDAAEKKIIAPVWLEKERTSGPDSSSEINYENRHKYGFDPRPVTEDIFAFPYQVKEDSFTPVLAVNLSIINPSWSGWAPFIYEDFDFVYRYGRVFTNEEWAEFQKLSSGWKEQLIWYWSFKSWNLPEDSAELDRYYMILYQLFYGCDESELLYSDYNRFLSSGMETYNREFSEIWKGIEADLLSMEGKYRQWVTNKKSRIYWDFYWQYYNDDFSIPDKDKLEDLYELEHDALMGLEEVQREAMEGIKYVELGGHPSWFQGQDQTPGSAEFVGQFWSDYMNVGSKLLYLFYDVSGNRLIETYDWD